MAPLRFWFKRPRFWLVRVFYRVAWLIRYRRRYSKWMDDRDVPVRPWRSEIVFGREPREKRDEDTGGL